MITENKVFLGKLKEYEEGCPNDIYLYDFSWSCGWYWGGGSVGNNDTLHCHFDRCFLKVPDYRGHPLGDFKPEDLANGCSIWENINFFLDEVPTYISVHWWRMKDLFKQYYTLKDAAQVFRLGGHCTSFGRKEAEIRPDMERSINLHLQDVIIPEIRTIFEFEGNNPKMDIYK